MNEDVKMLVKCSIPLAMFMAAYQITAGEYGVPDGTGRLKMAFSMKKEVWDADCLLRYDALLGCVRLKI